MKTSYPILVILLTSISMFAQDKGRNIGELIVKLNANKNVNTFIEQLNYNFPATYPIRKKKEISTADQIYLLQFDESKIKALQLLNYCKQHPSVVYAQFNHHHYQKSQIPNDTYFAEQWNMQQIAAPDAWSVTTGGLTAEGDTIVVAVLDGGFDQQHPDLQGNIWSNNKEIPDDGIDNDNNGHVDDYWGWNFRYDNDDHTQLNDTGLNHGTGVAGIIGAKGDNGLGVTGVNWNVKIMLLSIIGIDDQIASAYFYALEQRKLYNETNGQKGALVVATSISMGRAYANSEDFPLWCEMFDKMGAEGILSAGATANQGYDVDELGDMPTSCQSDYLVTVTNINKTDRRELNAAWGRESIDLGAPGSTSYTTKSNGNYGGFGGTSAATPHVTGTVALLYSMPCELLVEQMKNHPSETALMIKEIILNGTEEIKSLAGETVSGGRLNINNSMKQMRTYCGASEGDLAINKLYPNPAVQNEFLNIEYQTPDNEPYRIKIYNTIGQLIAYQTITPPIFGEKMISISTSNLSKGLYFICLESSQDKTMITDRFIVK